MAFSTNYENTNDYELIDPGEYEVIIKSAEERTTKNGKTGINFVLTIRNDVEQKFKNRCVFYSIWKRKEPSQADMQVQGYSFNQLMYLAKIAGLPSGKPYETVLALCLDMVGKAVNILLVHEEWNGNIREVVDSVNKTTAPNIRHVWKEKKQDSAVQPAAVPVTAAPLPDDFEEILGDGDVPF